MNTFQHFLVSPARIAGGTTHLWGVGMCVCVLQSFGPPFIFYNNLHESRLQRLQRSSSQKSIWVYILVKVGGHLRVNIGHLSRVTMKLSHNNGRVRGEVEVCIIEVKEPCCPNMAYLFHYHHKPHFPC